MLSWPRGIANKIALNRKQVTWAVRTAAVIVAVLCVAFLYYYLRFAQMIEKKLGSGNRPGYSALYASPRVIAVGDQIAPAEVIEHLEGAGYRRDGTSPVGNFRVTEQAIEVQTGPESYFATHSARLEFRSGKLAHVRSLTRNQDADEYSLEPALITNVFDDDRQKRRPIRFSEMPKHVVDAIVAVEDKRFFNHGGLDLIRVVKAAYIDLREGSKQQGASTITMQLARSFWLDQEKTWRRKIAEAMLTAELERRFSKEQILELYANEIYLGRRGSFAIHGFGEAARSYFGKEVRELSVAEAALLVGLIQRPSYYNPYRYPERVRDRRDLALQLMHQNGYLDAQQYAASLREPIKLSRTEFESSEAPYFVELVNDHLQERFADWDFSRRAFRVYTTLDAQLQQEAVEAVRVGMASLDRQLRRGRKSPRKLPQVALVALDPKTGAVRALIGGRNYEKSQLNRAVAMRQPGSSFKPFVYAAALQTSLETHEITPATVVEDVPTTFFFNRQRYQPANFADRYYGGVTLRQALMRSANIATIKVAEKVGYQSVVDVARKAGISSPLMATPSIALGSYEVTPLDLASAFTIFSNEGMRAPRFWATSIRDNANRVVYKHEVRPERVLDERVAFIVLNMMEDVIRAGTGAGVRSRGFTIPAAGKTGTSRDGWFVGFTSKLLCVVWVGYDDNSELEFEGARSALPIWTDFMKRAHKLRQYRGAKDFKPPEGLTRANIDVSTGKLAGEDCPWVRTEFFIAGTQPRVYCEDSHDEYYDDTHLTESRPAGGFFGRILGVFR